MILFITRMLCATLFVISMSVALWSQTSDGPGLEIIRAFVEEKDVDRVVTPAFLEVRINELDKLLKDYVQRRSLSTMEDTGIQRATYVARWNEQMLLSRASLIQVASAGGRAPLNIGRFSLAIEEPQGVPEQAIPLTRQLRYVDDNRLQILPDEKQQDFWFGFRAKTRRRDSGQHSLDLQVPQAVVSMMLIAAPTHTLITSNVPCGVVTDINKYLPDGWPPSALPTLAADEQWVAVWLSGQETCTLNFTPATKAKGAAYRMLVASAQSDTQLTPAGIQVSSQFRLAAPPPGGKLRLLIEDQLHVRSIAVGAVEATGWRTIQEEPLEGEPVSRARTRLIEVPCESTDNGMLVVNVDCIGRAPMPFEGALPRVEVEGAYVLDGRCTLLGHERIQVEDARSTAHVLATSGQSGIAQWQWQWTGKTPVTNVRLRTAPHQWNIRALTHLDVQADVVVASVHANISTAHVQGNQTTLKLASGWFVDSVKLENAPTGVTASISDTAGDTSELNIRWDERRSDLDVRVVLKAHYHQSTEVESLKLASTRILSLPGSDQVDTYVVESSGRFRLELDAELLRLRVREDDLVPWQRALLPRLADPWIFSAGHATLPTLRLNRTRATLEAKLHTTITEDISQVIANYAVVCKPISGSIKQLKIQMMLPANAVAPTWSIVEPFGSTTRARLSANSSAISSSTGETTFTIDLSEDVAEEFQIRSELNLAQRASLGGPSSATLSVPLPRMRQAVSQEAVLVVPAHYKLPSLPSIEILPPGLCCDGGKVVESSASPDLVAMRYDANTLAKMELQAQWDSNKVGWANSQLHEHWQFRAGRILHRSTWDLASPIAQALDFTLPAHWEFQSLTIDNIDKSAELNLPNQLLVGDSSTAGSTKNGTQRLTALIPKGNRVRVQLICSSVTPERWNMPIVYNVPMVPLAVLESRSQVWLPKSRWATAGWPAYAGTWEERFCPRQWWHLLSFQPGPTTDEDNSLVMSAPNKQSEDVFPELERANQQIVAKNNWWKLEFDGSVEAPRVWVMDQSFVGAACLCIFLVLCMIISLVCGTHWRRWWVVWMVFGTALAIVPAFALLPLHMFALALIASTLVRLARTTAQRSRAAAVKRYDTVQLSKSLLPRSGVASLWLLLALAIGTPSAAAQSVKNGVKPKREVFGILIPVDENYKVSGEFVYISPRLSRLLSNSNQSDAQASEVRVLNAIYSLSIGNDLVNLNNTVGDVTVELSVQATAVDAELRLPYLRSEATLVRASLDSQSLIQGDRIRQDSESILWRATDSDRHTLRLTLRPRLLSQREGRGQLSLGIPAIPTASLEVQSENISDLRELVVDSVGGVQAETFRTLSARLGPLNRLNVSWPLSPSRGGPTQVQSDTWIHTRGDKVMAMCQLRLRGTASLNGSLAIAGDSNWVPIGQDWDDFRMVATEGASALGRPIYNVEKLEDRNSDELTIKLLMLPKDESAASLSIPFLSMQQPLMSVTRTLALSRTDTPQWKAVGTDWQPLLASQAALLWDGPRLAEQPTLWKVPVGAVQANLQRVGLPDKPTVDEVTEVQMQMPETRVKYVARWSAPLIGPPAVRFLIPSGLRLDNVLVDAIKARYSVRRLAGSSTTSELTVFIDSSLGGIQNLNLQFSTPTRLNRAFRLPRPLLLESDIRTSVVQMVRGVELVSTHSVVDGSGLEIETLDVGENLLLQQLQSPIGRVELGDRLRDDPELPLEFTLTRAPTARAGRALMQFSRTDQGWRGQLDAMVEVKSGGVNHLFFDMPRSLEASLKDPLEANVAMTLWPSSDSNRMLLSVLPVRESADQAHISFAFRLPSSGVSQTLNIPDIRMLGVTSPRPAVALPTNLSGEAVRWTGVGRPLAAGWLQALKAQDLDLSAFDLFEPIDNQSQANWHPRQQRERDAQLLLTCIEVANPGEPTTQHSQNAKRGQSTLRGEICYWLEPHDHAYLDIDFPESCQLVGLEANDRPAHWMQVSKLRARILLQPSYLPSRLRLLVRWTGVERSRLNSTLDLPQPGATVSGPVLIRQILPPPGESGAESALSFSAARAVRTESIEALQAQAWANTLTSSAATASGRGADELAAWLPNWDPLWLGLNSQTLVAVRRQAISSRSSSSNEEPSEEVQLSVAEFWSDFLKQHAMESYQATGRAPESFHAAGWPIERLRTIGEFQWQQLDTVDAPPVNKLEVEFAGQPQDLQITWRWSFGLTWLFLTMAIGSLARGSLRAYCHALGELIWPLWLALAAASVALLPVLWPTAIILLGFAVVLVRRYRELRRDRQFVLLPKRLR